jgi:hypothetical protein
LLPTLTNLDSDFKYLKLKNTARKGDVLFKRGFYGRSLSPFECLFVKTNRDMISKVELCSYTFTSLYEIQKSYDLDDNGKILLNESLAFATSVPRRNTKLLAKLKYTLLRILNNILENKGIN